MVIHISGEVSPELDEELMAKWRRKMGDREENVYRELHRLAAAGRESVTEEALAAIGKCGKTRLLGEVLPALEELGLISLSDDN